MIYVAFAPFGIFGVEDDKIKNFEDIKFKKLIKKDEIVDYLLKIRTNPLKILEELRNEWGDVKLEILSSEPFNIGIFLRDNLFNIGKELGYFKDYDDFKSKMHNWNLELTKKLIKIYSERRDKIIIQVSEAISDLDKVLNLLSERLREWYSLYFPELDDLVENHDVYVKLVSELKERKNFDKEILKNYIPEKLAKKVEKSAKESMGAEFESYDLDVVSNFSKDIAHLYQIRKELYNYLDKLMSEEAPNLKKLAGTTLGAKLICLAGGLEKLSKMPASTIQVLGAEKALFAHLRKGTPSPKHGVIYNHPLIYNSPKWQRGKIARALACKLAIAARADFDKDYIADELYEKLMKRVEEIKRKYPKPPKKKKKKESKKIKKKFKKKKKDKKKKGKK
ncbi:hypothetical protein ACPB8Q_00715 [Methanocaldococcus indicus]|uniref:hypothetical protein n=1 Tax=Methanocaldococcus indicus TaxID=213231 RepID=UPI003C6D107F